MQWGKFVLLFQAIVTLVIGMVFLTQVLAIDEAEIQELKVEMTNNLAWEDDTPSVIIDLKQRYTIAAYMLLVIAIFEILVIVRLAS